MGMPQWCTSIGEGAAVDITESRSANKGLVEHLLIKNIKSNDRDN
jgi:hypothetical protein